MCKELKKVDTKATCAICAKTDSTYSYVLINGVQQQICQICSYNIEFKKVDREDSIYEI